MIRNLGDLGIYQVGHNDILTLKTPIRKYSANKDTRTRVPQEFLLKDLVESEWVILLMFLIIAAGQFHEMVQCLVPCAGIRAFHRGFKKMTSGIK